MAIQTLTIEQVSETHIEVRHYRPDTQPEISRVSFDTADEAAGWMESIAQDTKDLLAGTKAAA